MRFDLQYASKSSAFFAEILIVIFLFFRFFFAKTQRYLLQN